MDVVADNILLAMVITVATLNNGVVATSSKAGHIVALSASTHKAENTPKSATISSGNGRDQVGMILLTLIRQHATMLL